MGGVTYECAVVRFNETALLKARKYAHSNPRALDSNSFNETALLKARKSGSGAGSVAGLSCFNETALLKARKSTITPTASTTTYPLQ